MLVCTLLFRRSAPALKLVSPYSAEYIGFSYGDQFAPCMPTEAAISLLTECVPFNQQALLITPPLEPGAAPRPLDASLTAEMKRHFGNVITAPIRQRNTTAVSSPSAALSCAALPPLESPAERLPAHALDVVCFAANVFATLLQHAPFFLTACHRVLKPHGVIGIVGQRRLRVVGPQSIKRDWLDFTEFVDSHDAGRSTAVARASLEDCHKDIYLPFPHVRRRVFTSQYDVTVEQLVGYCRSWPEYQTMVTPRANAEDRPGVKRRAVSVDPLEALDGIMRASLDVSSASASGSVPAVRVEVDTFVITADSRAANYRRGDLDGASWLTSAGVIGQ